MLGARYKLVSKNRNIVLLSFLYRNKIGSNQMNINIKLFEENISGAILRMRNWMGGL